MSAATDTDAPIVGSKESYGWHVDRRARLGDALPGDGRYP